MKEVLSSSRPRWRGWWQLQWWTTPYRWLPHGGTGAVMIITGLFMSFQAVWIGPQASLLPESSSSSLLSSSSWGYSPDGPQPRLIWYIFLISATLNALAAGSMLSKAPVYARGPFLLGAQTQLALVWFAARFGGTLSVDAAAGSESPTSSSGMFFMTRLVDQIAALVLAGTCVGLMGITVTVLPRVFWLPILGGTVGLALTFMYPWQLAIWGNTWLEQVRQEYPYQRAGWVCYIYIPTLTCWAAIMFGQTLFLRKILSPGVLSALYGAAILVTLVGTILSQEVHISQVSTQRLLILPAAYQADPRWSTVAHLLDTSALAQTVLAAVGIPLRTPPPVPASCRA